MLSTVPISNTNPFWGAFLIFVLILLSRSFILKSCKFINADSLGNNKSKGSTSFLLLNPLDYP